MDDQLEKILVVDDLPDWRNTLSGLLIDEGYDVQVAGSSRAALELLRGSVFDLVVLDMRLDETEEGNTEGLELAAQIKHQWPTVKVIIITGYEDQETMRQAREPDICGRRLAEDYIPKTKTEQLPKVVRSVLAK